MEENGRMTGKRWKLVKSRGKTEENGGTPKLNGEQRSLGFGTREFARG